MSSKHFCLKWNSFQSSILNAFESLQNTEDLTDVTLTCEGINLKAHKFILSACSPYFRTVFKENPCSHPIVILKDVNYTDLIAIVNFMYHGQVYISEDQLSSFLQTAKLLQISGLNNTSDTYHKKTTVPSKKQKPARVAADPTELPAKKTKVPVQAKLKSSVLALSPSNINDNSSSSSSIVKSVGDKTANVNEKDCSPKSFEVVQVDRIKMEDDEDKDEFCSDINENVEVIVSEKSDQQGSILEAALELKDPKPSSILERSLTSQQPIAGKSPSTIPYPVEQLNLMPSVPELMKAAIIIPRKPPDLDIIFEKHASSTKSHSSSSDSQSPRFDRPTDILQQSIKVEGEPYEDVEVITPDEAIQREANIQFSRLVEVQQQPQPPHHSSLCGNCPHCGQPYSNQSALKYHVRLVHSDLTNMYCCHLCPESFDYREGYKKHMADMHCIRN